MMDPTLRRQLRSQQEEANKRHMDNPGDLSKPTMLEKMITVTMVQLRYSSKSSPLLKKVSAAMRHLGQAATADNFMALVEGYNVVPYFQAGVDIVDVYTELKELLRDYMSRWDLTE